jgi:hypothetical protein
MSTGGVSVKYCPLSCTCRVPGASEFEWTLADHLHSWKDDFLDWANGIVGRPLLRWTLRTPRIRDNPDRLLKAINRITFNVFASLDGDERDQLLDAVDRARRTKMRDELTNWANELLDEIRRRKQDR